MIQIVGLNGEKNPFEEKVNTESFIESCFLQINFTHQIDIIIIIDGKKATTYHYVSASLGGVGGVKLDQKMARRRREILGATNHHRQPNRHLQKQQLNHIEVSMIFFFSIFLL